MSDRGLEQGTARESSAPVIGLTAVILAVTDEVPRVLIVRRMSHALATPAQMGSPTDALDSPDALPIGPFDAARHRTLELGLRDWLEDQTGLPLRYLEQLYTFGDRYRDSRELEGGPRVVSVGYVALARQAPLSGSGEAEWRDCYGFLPWEDWRRRRPAILDELVQPRLQRWVETAPDGETRLKRRERVSITFGLDEVDWDFERALERYELLYEAQLVLESLRDRLRGMLASGRAPPPIDGAELAAARAMGVPMALDNRRILAAALGRLRGKLKYRPVVFDLLPPEFTLLKLQRIVEAISGVGLHKQNFRRLVLKGGLVEPTAGSESDGPGRPARLFRFRREVLRERAAPGVGLPAVRVAD